MSSLPFYRSHPVRRSRGCRFDMMGVVKFMLLIYSNPANWAADGELALPPDEREALRDEHAALTARLTASGEKVGGQALADPTNTTTVRVRDGELDATDGP